jgi:hypothetical protein
MSERISPCGSRRRPTPAGAVEGCALAGGTATWVTCKTQGRQDRRRNGSMKTRDDSSLSFLREGSMAHTRSKQRGCQEERVVFILYPEMIYCFLWARKSLSTPATCVALHNLGCAERVQEASPEVVLPWGGYRNASGLPVDGRGMNCRCRCLASLGLVACDQERGRCQRKCGHHNSPTSGYFHFHFFGWLQPDSLFPTLRPCCGERAAGRDVSLGAEAETRRSAEGAYRAAQAVSAVPILFLKEAYPLNRNSARASCPI